MTTTKTKRTGNKSQRNVNFKKATDGKTDWLKLAKHLSVDVQFLFLMLIDTTFQFRYILSQRANARVDYFANYVRIVHVFTKKVFKTIMPSHLSISWNISFNRQSLELEATTDLIEAGCL